MSARDGGWGTRRKNAAAALAKVTQAAVTEAEKMVADQIAQWLIDGIEPLYGAGGETWPAVCNRLRAKLAGEIRLGAYRVDRRSSGEGN